MPRGDGLSGSEVRGVDSTLLVGDVMGLYSQGNFTKAKLSCLTHGKWKLRLFFHSDANK